MKCKCVETVKDLLKKSHGEGNFELLTKCTVNLTTGQFGEAFPPIPIKLRVMKSDGSPSKKWKSSYIKNAYCPFCGEKQ